MLVEPKGARANSWEDVADLSAQAGIVLDGWQELILGAAMGERADATWAAKRVGVSVPRQNGKSQLLVARALAGVLLFGEKKIVISAHQQDTARETFSKMVEILEADGNAWLMERVRPNGIMNAINREAVKFKNGATVQFKARTGAGGRGFSSDCLLLDEAQRLKRAAWVSINSTMSAMPNPQVWLLGTPPTPEDEGDVFESIRSAAIDGVSTAAAWAEWGADPQDPALAELRRTPRVWTDGVEGLCWSANPAWNARMNQDVVQGEFESYTPEEFMQDRLGMWASEMGAQGRIGEKMWNDLGVEKAPEDGIPSYAVAFSADGSRVSVAGAFKTEESVHVELIDVFQGDTEAGLRPLVDWFLEKAPDGVARWRRAASLVLSGRAGAGVVAQLLRERKVPDRRITLPTTSQYFQAVGMFEEACIEGSVTHLASEGQAALDASVRITDKDKNGRWVPVTTDGDETPLEAVSLALWGARTTKRVPRGDDHGKALVFA